MTYVISDGFELKKIVDDYIVVAVGQRATNFNAVIVLNEVGVKVFQGVRAGKTSEAVANEIAEEYSIDMTTAKNDVERFLNKLENDGVCRRV